MAIITLIDGVPLYTTRREAINWADSRGLTGSPLYHTHRHQGTLGYMGGANHAQALLASTNINTVIGTPTGGGAMGGGSGSSY